MMFNRIIRNNRCSLTKACFSSNQKKPCSTKVKAMPFEKPCYTDLL